MKHVVTCFLEHDSRILILRRSRHVGSFRGKWAGVSGYIETTADKQAFTEIAEETGFVRQDVRLVRKGRPLEVAGEGWIAQPYLFNIKGKAKIKTDWEHTEICWIKPYEMDNYDTVPMLKDALEWVYELE